jgi:hypothetical protein
MLQRTFVGMRPLALALGLVAATVAQAEPLPLSKEEQTKVDQAIDKAIAFLKNTQRKKGFWDSLPAFKDDPYGATALPALALLEAGVAADDPVVQKAAECLRPHLDRVNHTYELSLALLFFDKLGDPQDKPAIRSLALRLIAGQCRSGGWDYRCPTLSASNEEALPDLLRQWEEATAGNKPLPSIPKALKILTVFQDPAQLAAWKDPPAGDSNHPNLWLFTGCTDNSNTQFAILALWVARRHGLPLTPTLRLAAQRFQNSQNPDGTWFYNYRNSRGANAQHTIRSMTTVGLLGLALREGVRPDMEKPAGTPDAQVLQGFAAVSRFVGSPTGQMRQPVPMTDVYYLWSLERLAMLYDLPTIAGKDWYRWGAEILVTNQARSGEWEAWEFGPFDCKATYGPTVNTSFALLFLKRSHLIRDMTAKLPYKPDVLEKGIAATLQGGRLPAIPAPAESPARKP